MPELDEKQIEEIKAEARREAEAAAAAKIAEARREAEREAERSFAAKLKEATGHDSLDDLKAERDRAEKERLEAEGKYKELAESEKKRAAEAEDRARHWESKYKTEMARRAIVEAAVKAGARDPEDVEAFLGGKAKVDEDGQVTVDGQPVDKAVADLLEKKPHWVKSDGQPGSGAKPNPKKPEASKDNPWARDTLNLTRQAEIMKEDPEKAKRLAAEAGVEIWE